MKQRWHGGKAKWNKKHALHALHTYCGDDWRLKARTKPYKDAKLFPGGSREWDWRETGTQHVPGIQPTDVEELLKHGATEVILSKGMYEQLHVCPETLQLLNQKGITTHILQTEEAVRLYNELRDKKPVGGLFHSTC
ncbi:MAG TPA: MTH938/NDUFAF3 family protein [Thermodesulfobacteriota bacterium]|nr:MTH938/NDUFAF3 family protein [Thermodesulfobacteriota bacterium]